jgi:acetyltransferase
MIKIKKDRLGGFFNPKSVAVIGASDKKGKVGNDIITALIDSFSGTIYPVNLTDKKVGGLKSYPSLLKIPNPVDLAVIVIPAQFVLPTIEECGKMGCKNIVIISAGFRELGDEGMKLEEKIYQVAKKYKIRILGPNCLGYISTQVPINVSFAPSMPSKGDVAFFSQSGALGAAVLDMAEAQSFGIGHFVSLGNKLDINEVDLLNYFNQDKKTKVILSYLEDIRDGRKFMDVASIVTKRKPIIMLKSGKTEKGQKAVSSHTGSLAGSAQAYHTAFSQSGVLEANGLEDFFNLAKGFSSQPLPGGNRVAIITNAGGPGIILTDLLPQNGLELAEITSATQKRLKPKLPVAASVKNPIDVLGDAGEDRYILAVKEAIRDKNVDAIIISLTPQKATNVGKIAEEIGKLAKKTKKTIIFCFMGEAQITKHYKIFNKYSIPLYRFPNQAVNVLGRMWDYNQWKYTPKKIVSNKKASKKTAQMAKIVKKKSLTEVDARNILQPLGFSMHKAEFAKNYSEAVEVTNKIKYPIALKVVSEKVLHKSDVGGVKLNIKTDQELEKAINTMKNKISPISGFLVGEMVDGLEIIIGMKRDSQFGPLVMVGAGGIYTEIFNDVAFGVAPFGMEDAKDMIGELKIAKLFSGARGKKPLDVDAVARILVKLSEFSLQFPEITEVDFNPVMVADKGKGCKIVDVRFLK